MELEEFNNRKNVEELISKLGKFDEKFLTKEPSRPYNSNANECYYYLVKPAVLIEKKGNKNKGVITGTHLDYGDLNILSQRKQYKEDNNVFNMWVKGEIKGSVFVTNEQYYPINLLNNERYFGCNFNKMDTEQGYENLLKSLGF